MDTLRTLRTTEVAGCDDIEARVARLEALLFGTERWIPLPEVARRFGVTRAAIYKRLRRGDIPARQFQRRWEIDPQWVAVQCAITNPTTSKD